MADSDARGAHVAGTSDGGWEISAGHAIAPRPMEDELLYSLFARCKGLLGVEGSAAFLGRWEGSDVATFRVTFPDRLDALVEGEHLARGWDVTELIELHTQLPYFSRFMSPDGWNHVLHSMRNRWPRGGCDGLPRMPGNDRLRLCPVCVERDVEERGMAAWRRIHQLPGVCVCPWHSTTLRASGVATSNQTHLVACPFDFGLLPEVTSPLDRPVARRIARGSFWLLANPGPPTSASVIQRAMRSLMGERGWLGANGMAKPGFVQAMTDRYGGGALRELNVAFGSRDSRKAAQRLWGSAEVLGIAPLACMLALDFIDVDVGDFFDRCREIADAPGRPFRVERPPNPRQSTLLQHRRTLAQAMRGDPGLGRKALRAICNISYCYLDRNDPSWLVANLPEKRKGRGEIDWKARDRSLTKSAMDVITSLRRAAGRPVRLTRARIVIAMGKRTTLFRRDPRLPRAMAAIARGCETRSQYRERVLRWAAKLCIAERQFPDWSRFCRRASFKSHEMPQLESLARDLHAGLGTDRR